VTASTPVIAPEPVDAPGVAELFQQADEYGLSLYPPESYHALDPAAFAAPNVTLLVARLDGDAVGMGAVVVDGTSAELKRMFVTVAARGRGIASSVLRDLETIAADGGATVVRLETGPPQVEAIALYERRGYVRIPNFGPYVGDPASVCFEKRLA